MLGIPFASLLAVLLWFLLYSTWSLSSHIISIHLESTLFYKRSWISARNNREEDVEHRSLLGNYIDSEDNAVRVEIVFAAVVLIRWWFCFLEEVVVAYDGEEGDTFKVDSAEGLLLLSDRHNNNHYYSISLINSSSLHSSSSSSYCSPKLISLMLQLTYLTDRITFSLSYLVSTDFFICIAIPFILTISKFLFKHLN